METGFGTKKVNDNRTAVKMKKTAAAKVAAGPIRAMVMK
jgi:hypothetical protein